MAEKNQKSLLWRKVDLSNVIDSKKLWEEEGVNSTNNRVVYRFYYDISKSNTILEDIVNDVKYIFPSESKYKAKCYTLSFKLFTNS